MKRAIITILVLAGFLQMNAQQSVPVLFVKKGAQGNGSSWSQAFGDLQQALQIAKPGTEVWVAVGEYIPSRAGNRNISFVINDGITLLGGFSGNETLSNQRNWRINPTILSGNIGDVNSQEDNSYNVVYTRNANKVVVDGFVICNGNAVSSQEQEGSRNGTGAAWFNEASYGTHAVIIRNCIIKDNAANYAAGIYNSATNGAANNSEIINCLFIKNNAKIEGGAMMNVANGGNCNVKIEGCNFQENFALYGGAIFDRAINNGIATSQIINNSLSANRAYNDGSDFFTNRDNSGINRPLYRDNTSTNTPASSNILNEIKLTPNTPIAKMRSSTTTVNRN